ncbi:hypothetical protein SCA04_11890 [Staphylococcus carnosus]|nr:hypothetical protein SCA04_11890 [Staphylococcus carnosus]
MPSATKSSINENSNAATLSMLSATLVTPATLFTSTIKIKPPIITFIFSLPASPIKKLYTLSQPAPITK